MTDTFDVVMVGAGMAGIMAARDLSKEGYSVILLEARDRVGGRTYTKRAFGREVKLGGAYVHWSHTNSDHDVAVEPVITRLVDDVCRRFPTPFEPGAVDNSEIEKETLEDRINSFNIPTYEREVLDGIFYKAFFETGSYWAIDGGTKRLINAIMAESSVELRISTPVSSITDNGSQVTVTTRTGHKIHSRSVIVALNTIGDIKITPDIPPRVRQMIDQKNPVMGGKIWARVKGEIQPFSGFASVSKSPINVARVESRYNGDTLILCMCSDVRTICADDREAVQAALREFVPDIQVIDTASHNWVTDEFSKGAWMMHRPGHLTQGALQMRQPHGRVHFAGGDIALPVVTSIDGAMGTGAAAARDVASGLASGKY
ncbi:monoamine oxidase [Penicillium manginii]|uniref:monoamine oxidase n=1 Tax=Penicillium manginii TaxID=203109 RepID=UPI00254718AA|nr:monoamine oxidase [Penicillium manginii]KAJ5767754.1 monoamine oxidase [Penicillium manginii]